MESAARTGGAASAFNDLETCIATAAADGECDSDAASLTSSFSAVALAAVTTIVAAVVQATMN